MGNLLDWRWVEHLTRLFELCQVTSAETAIIVTDIHTDSQLREGCHLALQRLSPEVISIILPDTGPNQLDTDILAIPTVLAAIREADFVADCSRSGFATSRLLGNVLSQGTRILTLGCSFPTELFTPHPELKTRVEAGLALLADSEKVSLLSGADAELDVFTAGAATRGTWGFSSEPSSLAHWPSGSICLDISKELPTEHSQNSSTDPGADSATASQPAGHLTLSPGDINLTAHSYISSTVDLQIEAGAVVEVIGTGDDVSVISAQLEALLSDNPGGSALQTLGWGMLLPAKLPRFANRNSSHSLLWPQDFPIDNQVVNLAGVCFLSFGSPFGDLQMLGNSVLFALRHTTLIAHDNKAQTELVRSGELQGGLAPDIYEIASRG